MTTTRRHFARTTIALLLAAGFGAAGAQETIKMGALATWR